MSEVTDMLKAMMAKMDENKIQMEAFTQEIRLNNQRFDQQEQKASQDHTSLSQGLRSSRPSFLSRSAQRGQILKAAD